MNPSRVLSDNRQSPSPLGETVPVKACIAKGPPTRLHPARHARIAARRLSFLSLSFFLASCAVGPHYHQPDPAVPDAFAHLSEDSSLTSAPSEIRWWSTFNDPALTGLILRAVESNLDLQIASARLREARALRAIVAGDDDLTLDANAAYSRFRRSQQLGLSPGSPSASPAGSTDAFTPSSQGDSFTASFDAAWELDFFGRIARSVRAADADLLAAHHDRRDVLVSLLGEVARNYIQLRFFQHRIHIALRNIDAQQASLDVAAARFHAGLTSELDLAQAQSLLAATSAAVPALQAQRDQSIHRLGVLLGQFPASLLSELKPDADPPAPPPVVPVGLPSDLLRQRPDIRRAERTLAAATERIGVATADLYPRFRLTGDIGLAASDFADLFQSSAGFWSIGPSISWPILSGGQIRANIEVHRARAQQSLLAYQQSILLALQDVEDNLSAYAQERIRWRSLDVSVSASRRAVDLASERYARGLVDYQSVLDAQRSLFQAEDDLASSQLQVTLSVVALYKALGGGWAAFDTDVLASPQNWETSSSPFSELPTS